MTTESPEPNYEKLMLWTFITIFALLGFFTVYNHYFPEENPRRPVPPHMRQKDSGGSDKAESPDAAGKKDSDSSDAAAGSPDADAAGKKDTAEEKGDGKDSAE